MAFKDILNVFAQSEAESKGIVETAKKAGLKYETTPLSTKVEQTVARNVLKPVTDLAETATALTVKPLVDILGSKETKKSFDEALQAYGKKKLELYGTNITGTPIQQSALADIIAGGLEMKAGMAIANKALKTVMKPSIKSEIGFKTAKTIKEGTEYTIGNFLASPVEAVQAKEGEKTTMLSPAQTLKGVGEQMVIGTIFDVPVYLHTKYKERKALQKRIDDIGDYGKFNIDSKYLTYGIKNTGMEFGRGVKDEAILRDIVDVTKNAIKNKQLLNVDDLASVLMKNKGMELEEAREAVKRRFNSIEGDFVLKDGDNVIFQIRGERFKGKIDENGIFYFPKEELKNMPEEMILATDKTGKPIIEPFDPNNKDVAKYTSPLKAVGYEGKFEDVKFKPIVQATPEYQYAVKIGRFLAKEFPNDIDKKEFSVIEPNISVASNIIANLSKSQYYPQSKGKIPDSLYTLASLNDEKFQVSQYSDKLFGEEFNEYKQRTVEKRVTEKGYKAKRQEPDDIIKLFFKEPETAESGEVKDTMKRMIDTAFNMSIVSHVLENNGFLREDYKDSIKSSFKNRLQDLIGIKPKNDIKYRSNVRLEAMLDRFVNSKEFDDALNALTDTSKKSMVQVRIGNRIETVRKLSNRHKLAQMIYDNKGNILDDVVESLKEEFNKGWSYVKEPPKIPTFGNPVIIDYSDLKTRARYGLLNLDDKWIDYVNRLNSVEFRPNEWFRRDINDLKTIFAEGNEALAVKFLDEKYEKLYDNPITREQVIDKIRALRKEIEYGESLYKDWMAHGNVDIFFNYEIIENNRAMMVQEISPQNSNVMLFLFQPKENLKAITVDDTNRVRIYRKILSNLDFKTHKMSDKEIIDSFNQIADFIGNLKTLNPTDAWIQIVEYLKKNDMYDDVKTMMFAKILANNLKEFRKFAKNRNYKMKLKGIISEVDSINSNYTLQLSMIGEESDAVGLNKAINPNAKDQYEILLDNLGKYIFGRSIEMKRGDIKKISVGLNYGALPYNQVSVIADILLDKIASLDENEIMDFTRSEVWQNLKQKVEGFKFNEVKEKINLLRDEISVLENYIDTGNIKVLQSLYQNDKMTPPQQIRDLDTAKRLLLEKREELMNIQLDSRWHLQTLYEKINNYLDSKITGENLYGNLTAIEKTKYKLEDNEKIALVNHLRDVYQNKIINAIEKENYSNPHIKAIKNTFDRVLNILYADFDAKYNERFRVDTEDLTKNIFEFYDNVGIKLTDVQKKKIKYDFAKFSKLSMRDIVNILSYHDALSHQLLHWKPLYDMLPKMKNGFGDTVIFAEISGRAGFVNIDGRGYQYPTLSIKDNPWAVFVISHDASIMKSSFEGGINRYDANYGSLDKLEKFSKKANDKIGTLLTDVNIVDRFIEALVNTDVKWKKSDFDWISTQRTVQRKAMVDINTKKKIAKEFRDSVKNIDILEEDLKRVRATIESNKSKYNNGQAVRISNYYDGSKETIGVHTVKKSKISAKRVFKAVKTWFNLFRHYKWLNKVRVLDDAIEKLDNSLGHKPTETFNFSLDLDNASLTERIGEKVRIAIEKQENSHYGKYKALRAIIHEAFHAVLDKSVTVPDNVKNEITGAINQILDDVEINGKKIDRTAPLEEQVAFFLESIGINDLIANNSSTLTKYFLGEDAKNQKTMRLSEVRDNKGNTHKTMNDIFIEKDGKKYRVWTFEDLIDFYREIGQGNIATRLKELIAREHSVLNSPQVLAMINDVDLIKAESIFEDRGVLNKIGVRGKSYYEWSNEFLSMNLTELFAVNPKRETLERVLSIKQGFEQEANNRASEAFQIARDIIKSIKLAGIDSEDRKANIVGQLMYLGIGLWSNKLRLGYENVSDFIDDIKKDYELRLDKLAEKIMTTKDTVLTYDKVRNLLEEYSRNLAFGNEGLVSPREASHRFIKRVWTTTDETPIASLIDREEELIPHFEKLASYHRISKYENILRKHFVDLVDNIDKIDKLWLYNKHLGNDKVLFGVNPEINLAGGGVKLYVSEDEKGSIGEINIKTNEGVKTLYLHHFNEDNLYAGVQRSDLLIADKDRYSGSSIYRLKVRNGTIRVGEKIYNVKEANNGYIVFSANALNPNRADSVMDFDISKQIRNNMYYNVYKEQSDVVMLKQINELLRSKLFITKQDYDKMSVEEQRQYKAVSEYIPNLFDKFGEYYFSPALLHYFVGTKGWDIGKSIDGILGKEFGRVVKGIVRSVMTMTKVLRNPILLYRLGSYINQGFSSYMIYVIHSNPKTAFDSLHKAKKYVKEYRAISSEMVRAKLEGDEKRYNALLKQLEAHPIHKAFEYGLATTIRTDAYIDGTIESTTLRHSIKNIVKNEELTRIIMQFSADSSTPHGKYLGDIFDRLEMIPKIALYLDKLNEYKDGDKSATYVAMSFPTYHNLNQGLAVIDEFNPFMKYTANIPKMLMFAIDRKPHSLIAITTAFKLAIYGSWEADCSTLSSKGEFIKETGDYFAIPCTGYAKYGNSMNPYYLGINDIGSLFAIDASKIFIDLAKGENLGRIIGVTKVGED